VRLAQTRNRCLYEAENALATAERLGNVRRECQQRDARIYSERVVDALEAVASIDEMTEALPRRAVAEVAPRGRYRRLHPDGSGDLPSTDYAAHPANHPPALGDATNGSA
jgi:hypothetical protein